MPQKKRVVLSWSSGKDSAWALHLLRQTQEFEIVALVTTFNRSADRVAMHAVRRTLVEAQAQRTGLPLWTIDLPWPCSNAIYEEFISAILRRATAERVTAIAFGDLFLEDIRQYRERQLHGTDIEPLFPLWHLPTDKLAREMIGAGVKCRVTCVDPAKLDRAFAGREFDTDFLAQLAPGIDPCGENGELHTFVYDAPVASRPVANKIGSSLNVMALCLPMRCRTISKNCDYLSPHDHRTSFAAFPPCSKLRCAASMNSKISRVSSFGTGGALVCMKSTICFTSGT